MSIVSEPSIVATFSDSDHWYGFGFMAIGVLEMLRSLDAGQEPVRRRVDLSMGVASIVIGLGLVVGSVPIVVVGVIGAFGVTAALIARKVRTHRAQ